MSLTIAQVAIKYYTSLIQLKNQQCETWMLHDEKQKLEFLLIQKDSRHLGEEQGRRTHG